MNISRVKDNLKYFSSGDFANVAFLFLLSVIELFISGKLTIWFYLIPFNIVLICTIYFIVTIYEKKVASHIIDETRFSIFKIIRYWYAVAVILISFKEVYLIINAIKPHDIDDVLIVMDWKLFGVNPTIWTYRFANPVLTEFLQIIYFFYYFMIVVYGLELFLWKRYSEYKYAMFMIVLTFWISYILYMFLPAIGPRFTIHTFRAIDSELPGILFTHPIRLFLDFAESIPVSVANPIDFAQRDAMPSVHVALAVLVSYLSYEIKSKSFYFYMPYSMLMIISTIYLRYHYVVDIFAGILVVVISVFLGRMIDRKSKQTKFHL